MKLYIYLRTLFSTILPLYVLSINCGTLPFRVNGKECRGNVLTDVLDQWCNWSDGCHNLLPSQDCPKL
jgi:hypothetical protein